MNTSAAINLEEKDLQLRYQLDGKRLICEVPFDRSLIEQLRNALSIRNVSESWRFPNVAAVVTVGAGVYEYRSGDYWDAFPHLDTLSKQKAWKRRFEAFLKGHPTLESFAFLREQKAHRYVAPILAHGGVPESCLSDLFDVITSRCSPDQTGAEALEYFQDNQPPMSGISVPVVRFIEFGGETAEDLFERLIALWRALEAGDTAASYRLPRRIRDAFCDWYKDAADELRASKRRRFPGPAVFLDPRISQVTLRLPPCDQHQDAGDIWDALGRSWPTDLPNEVEIVVAPEPEWDVICGCRAFHFRGVSEKQPAIFFDPSSGRIIREPVRRRLPEFVWALFPEDAILDPQPDHRDQFVQWPGYTFADFDLENHNKLVINGVEFDVRRPVFRLDDESLHHDLVARDSGIPVVAKAPLIDWDGEANLSLSKDGQLTGNIDITATELPCLIEEPGEYHLELRGSVGQNLQLNLLLLPGIVATRSPVLAWPDTKFVEWTVEIPGGSIHRGGIEGREFRCYEESIELEVNIQEICFPVVAAAPRLEWRLNFGEPEQGAGWTQQPLLLREGDLSSLEVVPILACRLPVGSPPSDLVVKSTSTSLSLDARPLTVRGENFWHFDLGIVRDQLLSRGFAERFELVVRDQVTHEIRFRGHLLEVRPEWDLSGLHTDSSIGEDTYSIRIEWLEYGHPVDGRWLTMKSAWRPWEGDVRKHQLSAEETRFVEWEFAKVDLRPGRYRICAVQIPWAGIDPGSAEPQEVAFIDVHKEDWPREYSIDESLLSVEAFIEAVLAHSYRPELVHAPPVPRNLSSSDIERIIECLLMAHDAENIHLSSPRNEPLRVFCLNASATLLAVPNAGHLPEWLRRCLPPEEVMVTKLGIDDQKFLVQLVFNWENIGSATTAKAVARGVRPRKLCGPMQAWRKALLGTKKRGPQPPSVGQLIFLCERDRLLEGKSRHKRSAYEELKSQYLEEEYL